MFDFEFSIGFHVHFVYILIQIFNFIFYVHISESSQVAEHCRTFSLSDERNLEFKQACQHEHDQLCTNCEQIHELLRGVNSLLKDLDHGEKEAEYVFILTQAEQSIRSWKKTYSEVPEPGKCQNKATE